MREIDFKKHSDRAPRFDVINWAGVPVIELALSPLVIPPAGAG